MKLTEKRIIVSLPLSLYENARRFASKNYTSVSGLVRDSLLEKIGEEFTIKELALIEKGRKAFRAGKGIPWRKVKH